jgi:hypothetical protein
VGGDKGLLGTQRQLVRPTRGDRENLIPVTRECQGFQTPGGAGLRDLNPAQQ